MRTDIIMLNMCWRLLYHHNRGNYKDQVKNIKVKTPLRTFLEGNVHKSTHDIKKEEIGAD